MKRFTIDKRLLYRYQKGVDGYVQITKIRADKQNYIKSVIDEKIGYEITYNNAKEVIKSP